MRLFVLAKRLPRVLDQIICMPLRKTLSDNHFFTRVAARECSEYFSSYYEKKSRQESCIKSDRKLSARLLARLFAPKSVAKTLAESRIGLYRICMIRRDCLRDFFFTSVPFSRIRTFCSPSPTPRCVWSRLSRIRFQQFP